MTRRIYVAGPYTKPDPCINTFNAIQKANELLDLGFIPFLPHLSHLWHTVSPRPYEDWMKIDFAFVEVCHGLFRLPGESSGADREVRTPSRMASPCSLPSTTCASISVSE